MILDALFREEHRHTRGVRFISGYGVDRDATLVRAFGGGITTTAGVRVDQQEAMGISAFYCGVKWLAWRLGLLPLRVLRVKANGDKDEQRQLPEWRVLHDRWNSELSSMRGREIGQTMRLLWGRAVIWIDANLKGELAALWPLHTRDIRFDRTPTGDLVYDVRNCKDEDLFPRPRHMPNILYAHDVIDVPNYNGQPIVANAREELGETIAAQQHGAGFYAGGALPPAAYKMAKGRKVGKVGAEKLRENITQKHTGFRKEMMILEDGDELQMYGMKQADMQFLESRQFYLGQIARWLDVQPHTIKDLSRATFSNIYEQRLEQQECLLPHAILWDQEFTAKLFPGRRPYFVEHNVDGILKANIKERYEAHRQGVTASFTTLNEVRKRESWNTLGPAGDVILVPQNMHIVPINDKARSFYEKLHLVKPEEEEQPETPPEQPVPPGQSQQLPAPGQQPPGQNGQQAAKQALKERVRHAIAKEGCEIRRAARTKRNFVGWIDRFYSRYMERMERLIEPAAETCRFLGLDVNAEAIAFEHCKTARAALLDLTGQVTAEELAERVERETAEWERTIPNLITEMIPDALDEERRESEEQ